jgi:hypothetical protein
MTNGKPEAFRTGGGKAAKEQRRRQGRKGKGEAAKPQKNRRGGKAAKD